MTDPTDDTQPEEQPPHQPQAPDPPTAASPPPLEAAPPGPDPREQIQAMREKATEAFKTGAHDARETFKKSFPRAKDDIERGINEASYVLGYAISFGSTLVKEFSPAPVTDGFERGAKAGSKAAEEVIQQRKNRPTNGPDEGDPVDI